MDSERLQILNMLKDGKISVEEAERLLSAVEGKKEANGPKPEDSEPKKTLKYLRIIEVRESIDGEDHEKHVNIRIPLVLLRAGAKLHSVLPDNAREKIEGALKEKWGGVGSNLLEDDNMETLIKALGEEGISIEIEQPHKTVKIFCE